MKFLVVGAVIGCTAFVPLIARTQSASIKFAADSIQREDPPTPRPGPYASIIRLKGDVEIKMCCVQLAQGNGEPLKTPPKHLVITRADEADYHQDTGEIEARGNPTT